jgi:hypothetical protein
MDLFITYQASALCARVRVADTRTQVPSDLLSYEGREEASQGEKLAQVRRLCVSSIRRGRDLVVCGPANFSFVCLWIWCDCVRACALGAKARCEALRDDRVCQEEGAQ